jgi:hypothetical protein
MLGHYTTAPLFARLCLCVTLTRVVRIISNFLAPVKPFQQPIFNLLISSLKMAFLCPSFLSHILIRENPPPIACFVNWIALTPITYNKTEAQSNFFCHILGGLCETLNLSSIGGTILTFLHFSHRRYRCMYHLPGRLRTFTPPRLSTTSFPHRPGVGIYEYVPLLLPLPPTLLPQLLGCRSFCLWTMHTRNTCSLSCGNSTS